MAATAEARGSKRVGALPAVTTSFLGRRHEIAKVKRLLSSSRIVSLTGPGGVGKTRLALHVANEVRRAFQHNVWFVELAELREAGLLANTVADALDLHNQFASSAIDTVARFLAPRSALLVLDNCEHLVEEAATFVSTLIRACPDLQVLATSRQSLGLLGESVFPLSPLPTPHPDQARSPASIEHYDSVRLFAERAKAVNPEFRITDRNYKTVARLCRELDGIPLAIELAAVRLRALSLEQVEERLRERYELLGGGLRAAPQRQRTLRALVDWSYDLCTEPERLVWARASVFSGSFDLGALEYVVSGDGVDQAEVLDILDSLVDKSIFLREPPSDTARYRMLETVREYGQRRLDDLGDLTAVRRRHRDWYARMTRLFEEQWVGGDQVAWIAQMRREHANLRVALEYCASEPGEAVTGLRMVNEVEDYWSIRGLHTEVRHWLSKTLPAAPESSAERVSGLRISGWFAALQGDSDSALPQLEEAAALADALGVDVERGYLTMTYGLIALFGGDLDGAIALLRESVTQLEGLPSNPSRIVLAQFNLGLALGLRDDRDQALALLNECVDRMSQHGDLDWRSWSLWAVAFIEIAHDAPESAESPAKQALDMQARLTNRLALSFMLDVLAWIASQQGQHTRAAVLFGAADRLWKIIGSSPENYTPFGTQRARHADLTRSAMDEAAYDTAYERGRNMTLDAAVNFALEADTEVTTPAPREPADTPLTRREHEVAQLVADGMTNKDIAAKLIISQRTAEAHVEHILAKLGFTSRAQIATWVAGQAQDQR